MTDYDLTEIILTGNGTRQVMSKPPALVASKKWIQQVAVAVSENGGLDAIDYAGLADWILNAMEEFAAMNARPVFDMEGQGPQCSTCGMIWPLCGHHHMSEYRDEDADD